METRYSVSIYNNILLTWLFLQDAWLVGILAQGSARHFLVCLPSWSWFGTPDGHLQER